MPGRLVREEWRKTLWRILSNPTLDVVLVLLVVALSIWVVLQTEGLHLGPPVPVLQGNK